MPGRSRSISTTSARGNRRAVSRVAGAPTKAGLLRLQGAAVRALRSEAFAPELCRLASAPPDGSGWLHEVKWDGYRIVATIVDGDVRLWSRNAIEWTHKLPELAQAIASLRLKSAQLDGEMIVLRNGRDDFNALQNRLAAENREPAVYMLFDLPHCQGVSLRNVALLERKNALQALLKARPHRLLRYSEHQIGNGALLFAQATRQGLEGIVCKRIDSPYSGARNGDWVKVKGRPSDEFVVVGYTEPKGSRAGIGALLLGKPVDGKLVYVGRVGTGIGDADLRTLRKELEPTRAQTTEVDVALMEKRDQRLAQWVRPEKIVEVYYQGIGGQGLLRQPAFKAFREDKTLADLGDGKRSRNGRRRVR